ncbi:hypothetical protein N7527_007305 [Penicillium freii]|nr:hypothetical protein N7527_007305 [Penicillium freii]
MSITSLPTEVISIICSHLQLPEGEMLRLSCRVLYERSLDHFSDRYFKSIRFIVTSDSLRELEDLAGSDDIRKRVQELWMIPTVFEGFHDRTLKNMGELSVSSKSCRLAEGEELKARYTTYKAMVADNSNLLESEAFGVRLRKCLERFENLDTIGLAHYTTSFLLDPRQQKVRFLGWRHLISQIDFRFTQRSLTWLRGTASQVRKVNSSALSRLLQALSGSGRKIKTLHTCNADYCADIAPDIELNGVQYNSLIPLLDRLEDLHLCIAVENMTWLNLITNVAPHLQRLTLSHAQNIAYNSRPYKAGDFYDKLELNRLKQLHLHQIHITSHSLKSMLIKSKGTLTHLKLFEPTSATPYMPSVTYTELQAGVENTPWKDLFDTFAEELSLQRCYIGKISCGTDDISIKAIDGRTKPSEYATFDAAKNGLSFREWVNRLSPVLSSFAPSTFSSTYEDQEDRKEDTANLVTFMKELKEACGDKYSISATLPSSYYYLKDFDVKGMSKYLDFFNFMSYGIHGTWDGNSEWTSVINSHTNLTVNLGLGFYGRSFTLKDTSCTTPGCLLDTTDFVNGGGAPGQCTDSSGILSDYEINRILEQYDPKVIYNEQAGVNWITWDSNQWCVQNWSLETYSHKASRRSPIYSRSAGELWSQEGRFECL